MIMKFFLMVIQLLIIEMIELLEKMFGCVVERVWGPKKFLFYYIACGVEAFQDAAGNIVMRKPATPGMENRKGVIIPACLWMR